MTNGKEIRQEQDQKNKRITKPGDIKGKLEVPDTRERRDGSGGN